MYFPLFDPKMDLKMIPGDDPQKSRKPPPGGGPTSQLLPMTLKIPQKDRNFLEFCPFLAQLTILRTNGNFIWSTILKCFLD